MLKLLAPLALACAVAAPALAQDAPASAAPPAAYPPPAAGGTMSGQGWGGRQRPPATPEMIAARRAMRDACAADISRLCGDAQAQGQAQGQAPADEEGGRGGRGGQMRGVMQCVRQHRAELSPPCAQAMSAWRDARRAASGA